MILQEMVCCNPDGTDSGSGEISPLYKNDTYDSYYVYALKRNNLNSGTTPTSVTVTVDEEYYSRLPRIGDTLIVVTEGISNYLIGYYKSQIVDQSITTPSSSASSTTDTFPSINIGQFSESLNDKADRDLQNLSSEGREFVGIKTYDSSVSYSLGEFIITVISNEVELYRSLANNNISALTDTTKWEEVELGGMGMPDYSAGVALSPSTLTTITTKGWINYTAIRTNSIGGVNVSGVLFQSGSSATNDRGSMMIPVDVGDTIQGSGGSDTVTFYPCKGVN